jgi:hypothetical protein
MTSCHRLARHSGLLPRSGVPAPISDLQNPKLFDLPSAKENRSAVAFSQKRELHSLDQFDILRTLSSKTSTWERDMDTDIDRDIDRAEIIKKILEQPAFEPEAGTPVPQYFWFSYINHFQGWTYYVVPQAGRLWVRYGYAAPRPTAKVEVWHANGTYSPINPGQNYVAVQKNDMLAYKLADPVHDLIKIGFQCPT